jgi:hypothetical protein
MLLTIKLVVFLGLVFMKDGDAVQTLNLFFGLGHNIGPNLQQIGMAQNMIKPYFVCSSAWLSRTLRTTSKNFPTVSGLSK